MILFLDFDGVLHPEHGGELFSCLPQLWAILRAIPAAEVVFSTSWREIYRPDEMLDFVTHGGGENLVHRFVGCTPSIVREQGTNVVDRVYKREDECRLWMAGNDHHCRPWLALDDYEPIFSPDCPTLYLVDQVTGLTDDDVVAIVERLA